MTIATATQTAVRFFDQLSRADVAWAGGKGANLGELTAAGMPGPGRLRGRGPRLRARSSRRPAFAGASASGWPASTWTTRSALAGVTAELRDEIARQPIPGWIAIRWPAAYEQLRAGVEGGPRGSALFGDRRGHWARRRSRA